jgi:hypothetical protein
MTNEENKKNQENKKNKDLSSSSSSSSSKKSNLYYDNDNNDTNIDDDSDDEYVNNKDEFNLYMNICKKMFNEIVQNKNSVNNKKEVNREVNREVKRENREDRENKDKKYRENDNYINSLNNITSNFMPFVIEHGAKFEKNVNTNNSNQFGYIDSCDLREYIPPKKTNEIIRPYMDFEQDEEQNQNQEYEKIKQPENKFIQENNFERNNYFTQFPQQDTTSKLQQKPTQKEKDIESIYGADMAMDEQKVHMANMLKHLGGLLTSMSHLIVK